MRISAAPVSHPKGRWEQTRILPAVIASLSLHGVLLATLPCDEAEPEKPLRALVAKLQHLPAAAQLTPDMHADAVREPKARQQQEQEWKEKPRRNATPVAAAPTISNDKSPPNASLVKEALPADTFRPEASPTGAQEGQMPALPARSTSPALEAADAGALERYGRSLSLLFAQQKQYPRIAALRGWEGEVQLRVRVARKGNIVAVELVHSSGFAVLDQHALQMVQNTTLPPPPGAGSSEGSGQHLLIDIPINYTLKHDS